MAKKKLPRAPLPKQRSEPHRVKRLEKKPKHKKIERSDNYDWAIDGSYGR